MAPKIQVGMFYFIQEIKKDLTYSQQIDSTLKKISTQIPRFFTSTKRLLKQQIFTETDTHVKSRIFVVIILLWIAIFF